LVAHKFLEELAKMIQFTKNAADKVAELIAEEKDQNLFLRIYVTGGGCSGFQYGFSFDNKIEADDTIIEQACSDSTKSVKLVIDPLSIQYLDGAEVDFSTGLQEEFIIRNPNAKTTCGCGSSFTVDE
jgi:iron-sulfur cluster insertion protein